MIDNYIKVVCHAPTGVPHQHFEFFDSANPVAAQIALANAQDVLAEHNKDKRRRRAQISAWRPNSVPVWMPLVGVAPDAEALS